MSAYISNLSTYTKRAENQVSRSEVEPKMAVIELSRQRTVPKKSLGGQLILSRSHDGKGYTS